MAERMTAEEIIAEYQWLTSNGVHPLLAAQELGKKPGTLARLLVRHGYDDLAVDLYRS